MNLLLFSIPLILVGLRNEVHGQSGTVSPVKVNLTGDVNEIYKTIVTVPANSTYRWEVTLPLNTVSFYIVQVHSYLQRVNLIHDNDFANGTNIGLVVVPRSPVEILTLENDNAVSVNFLFVIVLFSGEVPIPGGCSQENKNVHPGLTLTDETNLVTLSAEPAKLNDCQNPLRYRLFLNHTPEADFSIESYFDGISSMITVDDIIYSGVEVPFGEGDLHKLLASYPGTGLIAAIIVEGNGSAVAYVPVHTFSCPGSDINHCKILDSTNVKVGIVFLSVVGLLLCFYGREWELFELAAMSILLGGAAAFLCLYDQDEPDTSQYVWLCAAAGSTVAVAALFLKSITRFKFIHHHITFLTFSAFVYLCVFYFFLSGEEWLRDDSWFWSVTVVLLIVFLIPLHCAQQTGHLLSSAVLGSFLILLPVDLVGTTLKYIFFDFVRRVRVPDFKMAYIFNPFQISDVVLYVVWFFVSFVGIMYQKKRAKHIRQSNLAPNDTTPLLG